MELDKFKKLLENIKKDITENEKGNDFQLPLVFLMDRFELNLSNGYFESPNTYIFEANERKITYRLTLKFDESISNILAKTDPTNAIRDLKLQMTQS